MRTFVIDAGPGDGRPIRGMRTATERLQFVIRFAQMDLDTLRPGDWLNVRDDLAEFLGPGTQGSWLEDLGGILGVPIKRPLPKEYPEESLRALQAEVSTALRSLVDTGGTGSVTLAADYLLLDAPGSPGSHILHVRGTTRDIFFLILFHILSRESTSPILRCPECGTIFYRIGKQRYCSRHCSNRANVRTWRQREEVKHAEAERAHTRYETKKKREVGQGAKVQRRPRKGSTDHAETPRES